MKLFSKKKEEPKSELPPLRFPEFPKEKPSIPKFEHTIPPSETAMIKKAVTPPQPSIDIPIRKPVAQKAPEPEPRPRYEERPQYEEKPRYEEPQESHEKLYEEVQRKGQTLFVKIERYREASAKIEDIKDKIAEAEKVLKNLTDAKREEDEELKMWHHDMETIKGKILAIDRELFGG